MTEYHAWLSGSAPLRDDDDHPPQRLAIHRAAAAAQRPRPRRRAAPVQTLRADEQAWQAALAASGGDVRRLQVLPGGEIVVTNHANRSVIGAAEARLPGQAAQP